MYESPITIIQNQYDEIREKINEGVENQVMEVIHRCGVVVDKEELVKALRYDRRQYEKGYADGKAEQPKGKWLINSDGYYPYCSECKTEPKSGELTPYCPYCGARMNADKESENE